jgi:hypothetical protein
MRGRRDPRDERVIVEIVCDARDKLFTSIGMTGPSVQRDTEPSPRPSKGNR